MDRFQSVKAWGILAFFVCFLALSAQAQEVVDDREASFLPPPASLLKVEPVVETAPITPEPVVEAAPAAPAPEAEKKKEEPKAEVKKEAVKKEEVKKEAPKKEEVKKEEAKKEEIKKEEIKKETPAAPAPTPKVEVKEKPDALAEVKPVIVSAPEPPPAPAAVPAVAPVPAPVVVEAPALAQPEAKGAAKGEEKIEVKTLEAPVAAVPLNENDPEARGLLGEKEGGLGAGLWRGTLRTTVDRLMPMVGLPTGSAALNDLARRLFMSAANPPVPPPTGEKPTRSLIAQRIEGLVALGAVPEAWRLAGAVDVAAVDSVTLRQLAEAALISPQSEEVCKKVLAMMETHGKTEEGKIEWQKAWLICQLRAEDEKAVQLGLDMMRENQVKDDLFITLMNSNYLGGKKILPRQLTPLRPSSLAVLRRMDEPLPSELYARPDAALIPELLLTKAMDDKARLDLAERAALRGLITSAQLKAAYESVKLSEAEVATLNSSAEKGPRTRAILYQAMLAEQSPAKKIALMQKYLDDVPALALSGAQGALLADILQTVPITSDSNMFSSDAARILALASRPDQAALWLRLAREAATRSPTALTGLVRYWPVFALTGLVPDGDYAASMKAWLDTALTLGDAETARARAEAALLVLSAAGYAVPEDAWQRVMEVAAPTKQLMPSPALLDRLRQSAAAGRKGETALLSLLLMGGAGDAAFGVKTEVIRALRLAGLAAEAQSLARETLVGVE